MPTAEERDQMSFVPYEILQERTLRSKMADMVAQIQKEQSDAEFLPDITGKTICLDFDGVVHRYDSPWAGACVILDAPVDGAFDFIEECLDAGLKVSIFSSRSHQEGAIEAMSQWFKDYKFKHLEFVSFPLEKPPAHVYIDDRGINFSGTFPTLNALRAFKPWNK